MRQSDYLDIAGAADVQSLNNLLVRFANRHDFGIISGLLVRESIDGRNDTHSLGNTPLAFASTFASREIGKRDPVMRRLKRLSTPFTYDQSTYVNEQAADLWEVQAAFGYKTGIATALHLPDGVHFAIGLDRVEPLPGDEDRLVRLMAELQLLAVYAHDAATRLLAPRKAARTADLS